MAFVYLLKESSLKRIRCKGDGNCLFRCIAICVYGRVHINGMYTGDYHPQVRVMVLKVVKALSHFLKDDFKKMSMGGHMLETFEAYCEHMSTPSCPTASKK